MLESLSESSFSVFLRKSAYVYPSLEALHISAIAILFGSILVFDLALLGRNKGLPTEKIHSLIIPLTKFGFFLALVTGMSLFLSNPAEIASNRSFQIKLLVILSALVNVGVYQKTKASVHGLISIALWTSVIFLGRWIAYT